MIKDRIPKESPRGRKRSTCMRAVFNAISYIARAGCAWKMLPHDFPAYSTVYRYFKAWIDQGVFDLTLRYLNKKFRRLCKRNAQPTGACVDSQSIKVSRGVSQEVGFDGGKLVKGRKRFIAVDTQGNLLDVKVMAANTADSPAATKLFSDVIKHYPNIQKVWADGSHQGFSNDAQEKFRFSVEITAHEKGNGFTPVAVRWVVERSFGWTVGYRRLQRDHERLPLVSEQFIKFSFIRSTLQKLEKHA